MKQLLKALLLASTLIVAVASQAQVTVTPSQTANALAQMLVGAGVTVSNATLNCPANANGLFTVVTSNLGLDSGIVLTSGQALTLGATAGSNGNQTLFASTANNTPGDADLSALVNLNTFDACILEFDFTPAGDTIKFDYVFGSEEYDNFSCSSVNDVFGFFISGPGFATPTNIALIPGTTIPVSVNSTTDPAITQPGSLTLCNQMGPGSPFAQYYVDNSQGTTITYYGITTIFTAIAAVVPCTTYHLKLAVSDAGDGILDSGVFLKAGSLTSNAVFANPIGGGGLNLPVPYCVRGCLPGRFVFSRPAASPTPLTIKYLIQGDAINGVDYSQIADSVIIPAGQLTDTLLINPLIAGAGGGEDTVRLFVLSPYTCGSGALNIVDTAELVIRDSFYVNILSNDTSVCKFESVDILAEGDSLLSYTWTPGLWLSNPNTMNTTATPQQTITYTINATLPGSGCAPATDKITITIKEEPQVDAGPDRNICLGNSVPFNVTINPPGQTYNITWSPGTFLSNTNTLNPVSTPTTDITYFIEVDPGAVGCNGYDTVFVHVLPNDFFLANKDSSVCKGDPIQIVAIGDPAFTYTWTPAVNVSNPNIINPVITPDTTTTYTVTATFPGCTPIVKTLKYDVQPVPQVFVGPDREVCQFDTLQLSGIVAPTWYTSYTYNWTPANDLSDPTKKQTVLFANGSIQGLTLTVRTPAGCIGTDDMDVTVFPGNFGTLTPTAVAICPRDTVQLQAGGGVSYSWTPAFYLSDASSATPQAYPVASGQYTVLITDVNNCKDTLETYITVHPAASVSAGDDATLYPGDSVMLNATGNGLYFQWFPLDGLSNPQVSNPIAQPIASTRYYVLATTENGCTAQDSVDVTVNDESLINLPNAFIPGSQTNNEIKVSVRGIATLKSFSIFNRWGAKVFETSDISKGWDGRLNGELQPMGVYIYTVEAVTNTGRTFIKQGNITLIR